jgi:hypothetical protein
MPAFDLAELRRDGFSVTPLPDENGRIVDTSTLPRAVTQRLLTSGATVAPSMRMIGVITKSSDGGPGPYVIRFVSA